MSWRLVATPAAIRAEDSTRGCSLCTIKENNYYAEKHPPNTQTIMLRSWSIEQEINLYSLVCDYKPAGRQRDDNMTQILIRINENLDATEKFTADHIWAKLGENYDLQKVEEIERDLEEEIKAESSVSPRKEASTQHNLTEGSAKDSAREISAELQPKTEIEHTKLPENTTVPYHDADAYSSELSDIDGEDTELEKLQEKDILPDAKPVRRGRPKKIKSSPAPKETSKAASRKRARTIAKDTDDESAPKRRQLNAAAKRKKKATDTPKIDPEAPRTDGSNESLLKVEVNEEVKAENENSDSEKRSMDENVEGQKEEIMDEKDKEGDEALVKDDSKAKKPKKQPVRRSTRKK